MAALKSRAAVGKPRQLFCSWHSYFDPSSGAALCTRDLCELLAKRGWACKDFCGSCLDFEEDASLSHLLTQQGVPFVERPGPPGPFSFSLIHFEQGGVPVTTFP